MTEHDDQLDRLIETLKEPVTIDPRVDRQVMSAIEQLPPIARASGSRSWFARRWTIRVSPLGGLAAAAALAAVALTASLLTPSSEPIAPTNAQVPTSAAVAEPNVTQFVLVAPDAKSVALVGDFNDWSVSATRLVRQPGDGVWWISVNLPPGRYRYAFVVDGTNWRNDPSAPKAEDDFGRPNSVVTIGGA